MCHIWLNPWQNWELELLHHNTLSGKDVGVPEALAVIGKEVRWGRCRTMRCGCMWVEERQWVFVVSPGGVSTELGKRGIFVFFCFFSCIML